MCVVVYSVSFVAHECGAAADVLHAISITDPYSALIVTEPSERPREHLTATRTRAHGLANKHIPQVINY